MLNNGPLDNRMVYSQKRTESAYKSYRATYQQRA